MQRIAFPFLVVPEELIQASAFMIGVPGEPLNPATDTLQELRRPQPANLKGNLA